MKNYSFDTKTKVWVKQDYINKIEYSDGPEIEKRILEAVKSSKDVSTLSDELETHIFDWTSLCFLSKRRSNLLRPFSSYFRGKKILEVGCGAGPITRFLGECGADVCGIEPNLPRAAIAAERCRDLENVKIICDNIESFETEQSFDGIIQVGVLEYATKYSDEKDAPLNYLQHLKSFLKEDGFLITAIENQLGLKYFSGFEEDHVGVIMHSINDNYQPGAPTTWGRKNLLKLFENAGFPYNELFLPFPDYKLPSLIFYPDFNEKNQESEFRIESILSNISYMDIQKNIPIFSLDKALPLIAQNDLLYDLSNSFCVFSQIRKNTLPYKSKLFTLYNTERKKEFCKETIFQQENNTVKIVRNYLATPSSAPEENIISFVPSEPVYSGILYHYELIKLLNQNYWTIEKVRDWLSGWLNFLKKELSATYGYAPEYFLNIDAKINSRYVDAIPINLLVQDKGFHFIDLEVALHQDIELGYLVFRAVYVSLSRLSSVAPPKEMEYVEVSNIFYALFSMLGYQLSEELLDKYYEQEATLASAVANVQVKTLKGSVTRLKVRPLIEEIQSLSQQIFDLQFQNGEFKKEMDSKEKQVAVLERKLSNNQLHISNLDNQLQKKHFNIQQLEKKLVQQEEEIQLLTNQFQEKSTHIKSLEDHVQGLQHEVFSLSTSRKRMIQNFLKKTFPFYKNK